ANCEFFSVLNGVKYLINDPSPTNTTGIKAFYSGPALPAYVSAVQPNPGQNGVLPNRVFAQLTDESTSVVGGSIRLYVNGALTSPSVNKVGTTTSVLLAPAVNALLPAGPNNAALAWSDSAGTGHSNYWTFSVAAYATLDPSLAAPLGTEDTSQPGFMLHVVQIDFDSVNDPGDGIDNQVDEANAMIAGAFFPWYGTNVADPADGGNGGAHPAV